MKKLCTIVFLLLTVCGGSAMAQNSTVFPQFVSGQGWSTQIFVNNQGLSAVSGITVNFFDGSGNPLVVATNLGTSSSFSFGLNAGEIQPIQVTNNSNTLVIGYVTIGYPAGYSSGYPPVHASLVYNQ